MSILGKKDKHLWPFPRIGYSGNISPTTHIVGFCGKIYPLVGFEEWSKETREYCYTIEQVDAYVKRKLQPAEWSIYDSARRFSSNRQSFLSFFAACEQLKDNYRKMFDDKRSPIFLASIDYEAKLEWNALLGRVHFQKVFPPFQAFQEIRMFMSNLAQPEKPIPQLSDADMAHSKGHGDRYSFRTAPGTKPGRKKRHVIP